MGRLLSIWLRLVAVGMYALRSLRPMMFRIRSIFLTRYAHGYYFRQLSRDIADNRGGVLACSGSALARHEDGQKRVAALPANSFGLC